MSETHPNSAAVSIPVEVDAKAVRSESIRAVRIRVGLCEPAVERLSDIPRRCRPHAARGILHDLAQGLAAISQSLAEGVGYAAGQERKRTVQAERPPAEP